MFCRITSKAILATLCFVGSFKFLIQSIHLLLTYSEFSLSSWVNLDNLCGLRNLSISSVIWFVGCIVSPYYPLDFFKVGSDVSLSFLILVICVFSLFSWISLGLSVLLTFSINQTNFWFIDFVYCFYFLYFHSNHYHFLSSAYFGFSVLFSSSFLRYIRLLIWHLF